MTAPGSLDGLTDEAFRACVRDWLRAVEQQDPGLLSSSLEASMESHQMGFLAEKSRRERTVEALQR